MRNTKQKSLVLEIVNNSCNHPTAYEVYQECEKVLPNISLGTVYRNLNSLVEKGKIQSLESTDHIVCYDKVLSHDHFICVKCAKIIDLERTNISYNDEINGNLVIDCKIRYEGICCDCRDYDKKGDE